MVEKWDVEFTGVSTGYGGVTVVDDVSLRAPRGEVTVIVGANGSGKSTLLRTLTGQLPVHTGSVSVLGTGLAALDRRARSRMLAYLPQFPQVPDGISVHELVARGRYPHRRRWGSTATQDRAAVARALALTGTVELADRPVAQLSGGQRQRVWIALVIAQQPDALVLDEPTSFLDLPSQIEILDLIRRLPRGSAGGPGEGRVTAVVVLHDLNLAARAADHVIAMRSGRVVAAGAPRDVFTPETLEAVFGLDADVVTDPLLHHPVVLPRSGGDRPGGAGHDGEVAGCEGHGSEVAGCEVVRS